ncbi:Fic family protein [Limosilactobacillus reuteri]|uniref:Fic family protein n=1 Tax=Limosilactobacillus reuteri TaxID=1598 RepID=UPI000D6FE7FC|nr:Fic family protein [Limosilactobacillus reuteri]PWT41399.1 Fic family protein [Limosilactobacillus reuteri]
MINKYPSLKGIYYSNPDCYEEELSNRLNNFSTRFSKLKIHPFNVKAKRRIKEKTYEIFYVPTAEIDLLKEQIFYNSKEISKQMTNLPSVANDQLFFNTLIFELQSTNDIEGIRSSKKEIGEAVDNVINKSLQEDKRFEGLVKQYLKLNNGRFNSINKVEEFREIWNELVGDEEKDEMPDGDLFRRAPEEIIDGDKTIHEGDENEKEIINDLQSLLEEMNGHYLPSIEKCFIAHYFYEYIHPFYDGNGRTGRFIACSYLARKLDILTAVSLSSTIAENKDYYYKPFMEMSNVYNHGDATFFITRMMNILLKGQQNILRRINEGLQLLKKAENIIEELHLPAQESEILFLLFQEYIFGSYAPKIPDEGLAKIIGITRYKLNKSLDNLKEQLLIETIKQNPMVHVLSKELRDKVAQLQ